MIVTAEPVHIRIPQPKVARSTGVHVSGIIRCIAQETKVLDPKWCEELQLIEIGPSTRFDDPVMALRVCMGLAWEDWYIKYHLEEEGIADHPGEMEVDGIYMSPDAVELMTIVTSGRRRLRNKIHEIKLTYKSTKTIGFTAEELETQFMWMAQLKSYCHGANTTYADLHVLNVCGDYQYPIEPQMWRYAIEFTAEEIEENWRLMTGYKTHRMQIELGE